jgi:leucyl/phenylalanyl-tRNA--protein transferase
MVLTPQLILEGYRRALFPMAVNRHGRIGWFSPDPRAVIPLDDGFHIPHGLKRALRKGGFEVAFDTNFDAVIDACSTSHGDTWISPKIIDNYCALHRLGHAHSVEDWQEESLVGGLYGVAIGGAFFGESMFHHVTDASKVALVALVERLRARGFILLDTQWKTDHLAQFGTTLIPKSEYVKILDRAMAIPCSF